MSEFQEAIERIVAGPERKSPDHLRPEKVIIAYHEGGHAVVQRFLPKCDPVAKVTIISRGMALGYTMALPTEDRYLQSKSEFEDRSPGCSAATSPSSSSSATPPPAPATTSRRRPTSPAGWSPSTA